MKNYEIFLQYIYMYVCIGQECKAVIYNAISNYIANHILKLSQYKYIADNHKISNKHLLKFKQQIDNKLQYEI